MSMQRILMVGELGRNGQAITTRGAPSANPAANPGGGSKRRMEGPTRRAAGLSGAALLHTLDELDVRSQPVVHQVLNINLPLLRQLGQELVDIRV